MQGMNIEEYLAAYGSRRIRCGKSGAEVWELEKKSGCSTSQCVLTQYRSTDCDIPEGGKYILKYVQRAKLPEPEVFGLYRNEAYFYRFFVQNCHGETLPCLPEVLEVQVSDDEILILMKKYQELSREGISEGLLRKIMGALALIHTQEIPAFLMREQMQPGYLAEDQIKRCLDGWRSVLAEHPDVFDGGLLTETAARINEIIGWHHEEEQVLSHGDFHWDNLLLGENGNIVICDWQGVNAGGASGDISFFLSRLGADGITIEPGRVVELYCHERFRLTGEMISKDDMIRHMSAANIITSFQFWHQYLHGSACERVRGIYEKLRME